MNSRKRRKPEGVPVFKLVAMLAGVAVAAPLQAAIIVDTLGSATPDTRFSVFGSGGPSIGPDQLPGPRFTLTQPTRLTEIGGFVNNCKAIVEAVPQCPATQPFMVQIRPAVNGAPDPDTVIATFMLSHDDAPLWVSYESVSPGLILQAGTYFALFAPRGDDAGFLLGTASNPFNYQAPLTALGFINPLIPRSTVEMNRAAVRIQGDALTTVTIDVRPGNPNNHINPRSNGLVSVAILGSPTFDAARIRPSTVRFGRTGQEAKPVTRSRRDVNKDGRTDMVIGFRARKTGLFCGDVSATLSGKTREGEAFYGTDTIRTVGCGPDREESRAPQREGVLHPRAAVQVGLSR